MKKLKYKKKKKSDRMTLLIIPQTSEKPLQLNLSKGFIRGIVAALGIIIITALAVFYLYYSSQCEIRQVERLKEENNQKEQTIKMLDEEIEEIEKKSDEITRKQNEIKKLMGIKNEDQEIQTPSRGGKGGYDIQRNSDADAHVLIKAQGIKTYLNKKEQELDELLAQVKDEKEYFRSVPNQWPVKGEISSPYGWRNSPFGGRRKSFHDGIDIANNVGEKIVAAGDGKVVFSGWKAVYGKTVEIDHGYGFKTMYGHNAVLLVKEGDKVKKGDPIAKLGNTGRSTGPHVHFTIMKWGKTQDPLIYLP